MLKIDKVLMKWLMVFGIIVLVNVMQTIVFCADTIVDSSTKINLPLANTAGRLYRVSDNVRGLWMDTGSINYSDGVGEREQFFSLSGEVVNVKEFGAKGDGSTDDTQAFVAARAALPSGKGIIFTGPGSFVISSLALNQNGIRIQGASRTATTLLISGSGIGIDIQREHCGLENLRIQPKSGSTPTELVRLGASSGAAIIETELKNLNIIGSDVSGIIGVYMRGVSGVAGVYNSLFNSVWIDHCATGLQTYTVDSGIGLPISDVTNQKNASHTFIGLHITNCTTAVKGNTSLNCIFQQADIEGNTTGVDIDHIQFWSFVGGWGVQGNTTNFVIGTNAKGQLSAVGAGIAGTEFLSGGGALLPLSSGGIATHYIAGSRPPDYEGNISRLVRRGEQGRVYEYDAIVTTTGSTVLTMGEYQPQLAQITDGKTNSYMVVAYITAQEDTNGDQGAYLLVGLFKAARSGTTITVTRIGTTQQTAVVESKAAWDAILNIDGGATNFHANVNGDVGETVRWQGWFTVVEQRGQ